MGDIEQEPASAETLTAQLRVTAARPGARVCFLEGAGGTVETTWGEILGEAGRCAAALLSRGVRRGDRVAVLGLTSRRVVESIFGILLCGGTVVMLPLPLRIGDLDQFRAATLAMVAAARAKLVLVDAAHAAFCGAPAADAPPVVILDELFQGAPPAALPEVSPSDIAVLQFTSGSTRRPKAVRLSHASICANCFAIADGARMTGPDHVMSWLPLYHDMGLIGGLFTPMCAGLSLTIMPPQRFALQPALWMQTISQRRVTITVAPNFAYALSTRVLGARDDLDLSSLRVALCGAEPIVERDLAAFLEAGRRSGLRPDVMVPCYGLAEATLAVTFAPAGRPLVVDRVEEQALERSGRAIPGTGQGRSKSVVSVGRPLRGVNIQVVDEAGCAVSERVVGEVRIASCSLMGGYDGPDEGEPLTGGWLATGDLGYIAHGELFVCGRKKELIKINGRGIWPDDVEHIAQEVPGVRKGNACAFGVVDERGHEALIVVAEVSKDGGDSPALAGDVIGAVTARLEVAPRHVVLLPPGSLPKTTSGKLARGLIRHLYKDRALPVLREAGQGVAS